MNVLAGLIHVSKVAKLIPGRDGDSISPTTVTRWISTGVVAPTGERVRLAAVRVGSRLFVRECDLNVFVAAMTGTAPQPSPADRQKQAEAAQSELARELAAAESN